MGRMTEEVIWVVKEEKREDEDYEDVDIFYSDTKSIEQVEKK